MGFTPKSEMEIKKSMCWEEGIYDFEVTGCELKDSKKGNPMLALKLDVFDSSGNSTSVRDWLVESDQPLPLMKLRHYCRATGAMDAYESGSIENVPGVGSSGRLKLGVRDSDQYGPQNEVSDYLFTEEDKKPQGANPNQAKRANELQEDQVPF